MKLRSAGQEQVVKLLLLLIYAPLASSNAHGEDVITRISGRMKDAGQSLKGMMSLYTEVALAYAVEYYARNVIISQHFSSTTEKNSGTFFDSNRLFWGRG